MTLRRMGEGEGAQSVGFVSNLGCCTTAAAITVLGGGASGQALTFHSTALLLLAGVFPGQGGAGVAGIGRMLIGGWTVRLPPPNPWPKVPPALFSIGIFKIMRLFVFFTVRHS